MSKISESTKSIIQLKEYRISVSDDGRAKYDNKYKFASSKIGGDKNDSIEIGDNEVKKNQKPLNLKNRQSLKRR